MARPPKDPGDTFGPADLAAAMGATVSNYDYVVLRGSMPRERSITTLKRAAVLGAFYGAGVALVSAARLAEAIAGNMRNQADGEVPARLEDFFKKLPADRMPSTINDYWMHRALCEAGLFQPRTALKGDVIVEILDRRTVLTDALGWNVSDYLGRIEGWGSDAFRLVPWWDEQPDVIENGPNALIGDVEAMRRNSLSRLVINCSLAVRNALDAVAAYRTARLKYPKASRSGETTGGRQ